MYASGASFSSFWKHGYKHKLKVTGERVNKKEIDCQFHHIYM